MRKVLLVGVFVVAGIGLALFSRAAGQPQSAMPQFTADGKLVRPEGYRRWVYVSSGYGMSYTQSPSGSEDFNNGFVVPAAYDYFVTNGEWPHKTMVVLESYSAPTPGA